MVRNSFVHSLIPMFIGARMTLKLCLEIILGPLNPFGQQLPVLQNHLLAASDVFGALEVREEALLVVPDDTDFANLGFSGFADGTVQRFRSKIAEGGAESAAARDALMLLLRLARGTA